MVDYKNAWKVRITQIIVINIIFAVIGIVIGVTDRSIGEAISIWFFGSWMVETFVSAFSKSGDKVSTLARSVAGTFISGSFTAASGGSMLGAFLFVFYFIKALFGLMLISVILVVELFAFPFTTIYYFVRSR